MFRLSLPSIPIIYEDNHLLVVVKPPNMPTQADDSLDLDLLTALKEDIKQRYAKPGSVYLGLVHRLDRPVGGAMVFAKTSKAASRLSESVRSRDFGKCYWAVVHGTPKKAQNRLVHYLYKNTKTNMVTAVDKNHPEAKEAILEYQTIGSKNGLSLVYIVLHTGRSHQIRVQFATIGYPLYGDQRYGVHVNQVGQQIALWSGKLIFEHPTLKGRLTFYSIPPITTHPWNGWEEIKYQRN
ncbi:MAG: RNA pseudouridine synthase [Paenibacillaceae bacterium]